MSLEEQIKILGIVEWESQVREFQLDDPRRSWVILWCLLEDIKAKGWWYELAKVEYHDGIYIRARISKSGVFAPSDTFIGKGKTELEAVEEALIESLRWAFNGQK